MIQITSAKIAQSEDLPFSKLPELPTGQFYFKGDLCQYTGKSEMLYGKMAYEFIFLEGLKKGETGHTYNPPS